mgnify:CR=1 FL=1|jgi:hypothetical protein
MFSGYASKVPAGAKKPPAALAGGFLLLSFFFCCDFVEENRHADYHAYNGCDAQHAEAHIVEIVDKSHWIKIHGHYTPMKKLSTRPPAMTDAIWPDTFTPMECMSRKFWLSSCRPIL